MALIITLSVCCCSGNRPDDTTKQKKQYNAGERKGADPTLVDISESKSLPELLTQRWDNKDDLENVTNESDELEVPFRGFCLFSDGSLVKDPRNTMVLGRWNFDSQSKILQFNLANGLKERYVVRAIRYDELVLNREGEKGNLVKYTADGFVHPSLRDDPFFQPNLQWRLKPAARENEDALRKRLKDCLHFYYLFYIDNDQRNSAQISFYGLPGCFIWYAGGIHLKKEEKLDQSWKNIFYDNRDASRAYSYLDKMISRKYVWEKGDASWISKNAAVLKQMEEKMDSL